MTRPFVHASVAATSTAAVTSTAIAVATTVAVGSDNDESISTVTGLSGSSSPVGMAGNPEQAGNGRANYEESSEPEEYLAQVLASSPNDSFEGTLR
ncbi:hypothetical protein [Ensifer sp. Root142]|uniref:hypothetical protein n=1 Tax=Ensifer sp. Root142 TaxID=1736461 RepID=UPI000A4D5666|nr:hypothetical protein [Ensifer sp. Root142]MDP9632092.1 hypothetical protein [Ensifer adhaerens]